MSQNLIIKAKQLLKNHSREYVIEKLTKENTNITKSNIIKSVEQALK